MFRNKVEWEERAQPTYTQQVLPIIINQFLVLLGRPFSLSFEFSAMEIAHHSVIKIALSSFLLMCHHHNVLTTFSYIHTLGHYPKSEDKKRRFVFLILNYQ